MGPKPTLYINFVEPKNQPKLAITSAALFNGNSPTGKFTPFQEIGPQRLRVYPDKLFAMAYGFAKYLRLEVKFSDGVTRKSQVFQATGMSSHFDMSLQGNSLLLKPSKSVRYLVVPQSSKPR